MSQQISSSGRVENAFLRLGDDRRTPGVERNPISNVPSEITHGHQEQPITEGAKFRPGLEVDEFAPGRIIRQLLGSVSSGLTGCLRQIRAKTPHGARTVGLIAPEKGHGCTTTALLLAFRLSGEGASALVIDASPDRQLADSLSLDIDSGWEQAVIRRRPLREVIIHSHKDGFDVLPGQGGAPLQGSNSQPVDWPEILAAYDWILIDFGHSFARAYSLPEREESAVLGGTSAKSSAAPLVSLCSSFIVVQRYDSEAMRLALPVADSEILGVIETFVQPRAGSQVLANPREAA
ncbi:MAG: cellulose synthase operon protein YhjQ/BcsQ [Thermogutta sp.]